MRAAMRLKVRKSGAFINVAFNYRFQQKTTSCRRRAPPTALLLRLQKPKNARPKQKSQKVGDVRNFICLFAFSCIYRRKTCDASSRGEQYVAY